MIEKLLRKVAKAQKAARAREVRVRPRYRWALVVGGKAVDWADGRTRWEAASTFLARIRRLGGPRSKLPRGASVVRR